METGDLIPHLEVRKNAAVYSNPRWININTQKPSEGSVFYLVFCNETGEGLGGYFIMLWENGVFNAWPPNRKGLKPGKVTYWMELPTPPI